MKPNETQLRQLFVRATDAVVPPAPWLEARVVANLEARTRAGRPIFDLSALRGIAPDLRLIAGVVAVLVALVAVAALLTSTRLANHPSVPGGTPRSVQTPDRSLVPFAPSPAVRGANWPPGGPVPAALAGAWQPPLSAPLCQSSTLGCILHLGVYTFQVGEEYLNPPPPGNVTPLAYGNVVVNGFEIDFISDVCTTKGDFGFERYRFALSGNTLVLTRAQGAGQTNCGGASVPYWPNLAGTYSRVASA